MSFTTSQEENYWEQLLETRPADGKVCRFCGWTTNCASARTQHEALHLRTHKCTSWECLGLEWTTSQRARLHHAGHQTVPHFHAPRRLAGIRGRAILPEWTDLQPEVRVQRMLVKEEVQQQEVPAVQEVKREVVMEPELLPPQAEVAPPDNLAALIEEVFGDLPLPPPGDNAVLIPFEEVEPEPALRDDLAGVELQPLPVPQEVNLPAIPRRVTRQEAHRASLMELRAEMTDIHHRTEVALGTIRRLADNAGDVVGENVGDGYNIYGNYIGDHVANY